MATMTNEQIEQKKQQLKQLAGEVKQLTDELVEAGACSLSDDDLDKAAGGGFPPFKPSSYYTPTSQSFQSSQIPSGGVLLKTL